MPKLFDYISSPLVFCIHGNKFGIAKCCDDLDLSTDSRRDVLGRLEEGEGGRRGRGGGGGEDRPLLGGGEGDSMGSSSGEKSYS